MTRIILIFISMIFVSTSAYSLEAITPELKSSILERCRGQMEALGVSLIKACADKDLESAKALINYPRDKSTTEIISRCERSMSQYGWSLVKACTDQDLEAKIAVVKLEKENSKIVASCKKRMKGHGWNLVKSLC